VSTTAPPRRRKSDRGWRSLIRENFYRDVWLLLITLVLFLALKSFQDERWRNVYGACESANARYTASLAVLNDAITNAPKDRREEAQANKGTTIRFIVGLVGRPHFDRQGNSTCRTIADRQVSRWW